MSNIFRFLGCGAVVLLVALSAKANLQYSYYYSADQSNYSGDPGSTVQVNLYLNETTSLNPSVINANSGLQSASVAVSPTGVFGPPPTRSTISAIAPNNQFDGTTTPTVSAGSAELLEKIIPSDSTGVQATQIAIATYQVLLGTLSIHVGSSPGQVTQFQVSPNPSAGNSETLSPFVYNFDADSTGDADFLGATGQSFTVTTAPEPTSLVFAAVAALGLFHRRRAHRLP